MSWQTYVDEHLMCDVGDGQGHHLTSAAIIGLDGSVWAQSANFPQVTLCLLLDHAYETMDTLSLNYFFAFSYTFNGQIYNHLISGVRNLVSKLKNVISGITIKKTGQSMVFGLYEEPVTPGQCNMVVERLGDYLIEQDL
ncbi:unnamed protein product [Brassica rapa]|uniref:Profilin n=2 Tax=Brassica TaxID=3705 RepID=A0A816Y8F7_BRANA|nr:unnamed protein product [Brassica napus]CAG7900467.1 unnamed protein product [Brassica rapa]VDC95203.1 unnamed protein product [Brassica rapa]